MSIPSDPAATVRWGRFGVAFAAVWLVFLLDPLLSGWHRGDPRGWSGMVLTVGFAAWYLWVIVRAQRDRIRRRVLRPPVDRAVVDVTVLAAAAVGMTVTLGEPGLASTVYVAVAAVMLLPTLVGGAVAITIAVVVEVVATRSGWSVPGLPFVVCAAALAMAGVIALMNRNIVLLARRDEDERRAVQEERVRMARDLHDILGHSLTVVTVKAQLANRLLDVDIDRARAELDDLERLSRDALADVRSAVEGFRGVSLPVEIARAREALRAAGIDADLPGSTDTVPTRLRELFAWTVREAVTNVVRHSGATRCTVTVDARQVTIVDDGSGPGTVTDGNGLIGLRERAAAAGARVIVTHPLPHGFSVRVVAEEAPS